jgi:hypothetical protein
MVASSAEKVQRPNALGDKKVFDRLDYRSLEREHPVRVEIWFPREVKVHILDVQIGDQELAVPQRALDVTTLVQAVE